MLHSAAIGAACPPRFGGGRYRLPGFFCIGNLEADCKETKTRKQKSSRKAGMLHSPHFSCYTPPFVPVTKSMRTPVTRKNAPNWPLKPAPKTGWRGTSNSRQSRPLPRDSLREVFATPCTASRPRPSRRTAPKIGSSGKWGGAASQRQAAETAALCKPWKKQVVLEENWQVLAVVFPPFAQRLENSVSRACWPSSMSLGVFHSFHGPCYCSRLY